MDREEQLDDERRRIGNALTEVLASWPQLTDEAIADALETSASTVNRWRKGDALPSRSAVHLLERYLDLRPGEIERRAGYVSDDPMLAEEAIARDPNLSLPLKRSALDFMGAIRDLARKEKSIRPPDDQAAGQAPPKSRRRK